MKKSIFLFIVLLFMQYSYSQTRSVKMEDFDGSTIDFTVAPQNSWVPDTDYSLPGSSQSKPTSYRGRVPLQTGSMSILTSYPAYDFQTTMYTNVQLRFSHICKVSPSDKARVEYRRSGESNWHSLERGSYKGASTTYDPAIGFNAASYPEWNAADSSVVPAQWWWKEETFDLSSDLASSIAELRFVITKGNSQGSQLSYGWLIENVEMIASTQPFARPTVSFVSPFPKDTVFSTGPWTINAKVKTMTSAPIEPPYLYFTATVPGNSPVKGSIPMINVSGDSLWRATLPQYPIGTDVTYSIIGRDTDGNESLTMSGYVVAAAPSENYVIVGTGTAVSYNTPIDMQNRYSWSRQIYLASELSDASAGGTITRLAWNYAHSSGITNKVNQKCYFKAVDEATAVTAYMDPISVGATLVWSGTYISTGGPVWTEIELDEAFNLPPGKNLMVFWFDEANNNHGSSWVFNHTPTATNMTAYASDWSVSVVGKAGTLTNLRPNARFHIVGYNKVSSAGIYSIDIPSMVTASPTSALPIVVSIKNRGLSDLGSLVVSYSVNNSAPVSKNLYFNPSLSWDLNYQDTLGYYSPKVNGYDTVTVTIGMPNGVPDEVTSDDTLTKIIYGSSDIVMTFVGVPNDTVYETKAQEIKAQISTLSGTAITSVSLNVTYTVGGTPTNAVLPMVLDASDNLWKATIPSRIFGTDVAYSITLIDILGNNLSISKNYAIRRFCAAGAYAGVFTRNLGTGAPMMPLNAVTYTYTQQIFLASEVESGIITEIGFDVKLASLDEKSIDVYLGYTDKTVFTGGQNVNVPPSDLELVYSGNYTFSPIGWNLIPLQKSFVYDKTKGNLVVAFDYNSTGGAGSITFNGEASGSNAIRYQPGGTTNPAPEDAAALFATLSGRSNIQLMYDASGQCNQNTVAMMSINSPSSSSTLVGSSIPVQVTIFNKGTNNITACTIGWSLNGVLRTPVTYSRTLLEGLSDTITIGSYMPTADKRDTIVVWVNMPNNVADAFTADDTLTVSPLGCQTVLSGNYLIGDGKAYANINDVINAIRNCGVAGDITLQLKGTHVGNADLSLLKDYMQGYSLTITSFDNHPDSATIRVSADAGILLNKSDNVLIKAITIDATTATANSFGIQFAEACTNVVIRDCKIFVNPVVTVNTVFPISKAATGLINNVSIINNLLGGGSMGLNFYAGTSSASVGTNIVIDSNTIVNSSSHGAWIRNANGGSFSYNVILSRESDAATSWTGVQFSDCNGMNMIGNRIKQRSTVITAPTGVFFSYFNYDANNPNLPKVLVANNEFILSSASSANGGIYVNTAMADIVHNSVYITGSGAERGINIMNSNRNNLVVKNNNIVMTSTTAHPIYFNLTGNLTLYNFDYNNMYAPQYVGYYSANIANIPAWQQLITTDQNSVKILPSFINVTTDLNLSSDMGLWCPALPSVTKDILGATRSNFTAMGCYAPMMNGNVMLQEITGLTNGVNAGQTENVVVKLFNTGATTVTSVNLGWSINGVVQPSQNSPVSLQRGDDTTVTIGAITYPNTNVCIKVWVNSLNNGTLVDEKKDDDTLNTCVYVCTSPYSGRLTVGTGGTFPNLETALDVLGLCGVSGDITLALMPDIYTPNIDLSNNMDLFGNYKLTLTSSTGNANDVTIRPSSGVGISLGNSTNITIDAITIDATAGTSGIQFASACTNITIKDCKILTSTTATAIANSGIYKANATGNVDNIQIINNSFDGGYAGICFYGGQSATSFGQNVRIDNNKITNFYNYGMALYNTNFQSVSYNKVTTGARGKTASYYGMYFNNLQNGGDIIGNSVLLNTGSGTTTLQGMYLTNPAMAMIANNEISLNSTLTTAVTLYGLYVENPKDVKVYHNTVYNAKSGTTGVNRAFHTTIPSSTPKLIIDIKNNIFVATGGASATIYAIYFGGALTDIQTGSSSNYNYYRSSGTNLSYLVSNRNSLAALQQNTLEDVNSVSETTNPTFINVLDSLELSSYSAIFECPRNILTDIRGYIRQETTNKGAYAEAPTILDLMLAEVTPWNNEVINNQVIPVNVRAINAGGVPITSATFGWSLNGVRQQPNVTWSATPTLEMSQQTIIPVGSFTASNAISNYEVKVWIEDVNSQSDAVSNNDIISTTRAQVVPLAEFVAPFVKDTILELSFDVYAKIRPISGAPLYPPTLYLESIVNGNTTFYDTITMSSVGNDVWVANVPQQYYNSSVRYYIPVQDNLQNNLVLRDTTYIKFLALRDDTTITIGAGVDSAFYIPYYTGFYHSFSQSYYKSHEISPNNEGVMISSISFYNTFNGTSTLDNVSFYLRASTDSIVSSAVYSSQVLDGSTLVWGPATSRTTGPGWVTFTLDKPFYLPANMNLWVGCLSMDGDNTNNGTYMLTWRYTPQIVYTSSFTYSDIELETPYHAFLSENRADIQIGLTSPSKPYVVGNNLAMMSVIEPVNDINGICSPHYSPIRVSLSNLGDENYDFSEDSIQVGVQVNGPNGYQYYDVYTIASGSLLSGTADEIEVMSNLSILTPGNYDIKAWVSSPLDQIIYDDTLYSTFVSRKIILPVDEDFSNASLPHFHSYNLLGSGKWEADVNPTGSVLPDYGDGVLRFEGSRGAMAIMSTLQLDLYQASNPFLEFWYYHDSTLSNGDYSYTLVNVLKDGEPTTLLTLTTKDGNKHGWTYYRETLTQFTAANHCILVQFESMNWFASTVQYIDHIHITSDLDVAVSEIFISPKPNVCDGENRNVDVVIKTLTTQSFDFTANPTEIELDIQGTKSRVQIPGKIMEGNTSDTFRIASNVTISEGVYDIKAYLVQKIDSVPSNDTAIYVVNINPQFKIELLTATDAAKLSGCFYPGMPVTQKISIENTGTVELSNIVMILDVEDPTTEPRTHYITRDTLKVSIPVGGTEIYSFKDQHNAPFIEMYVIEATAYLECDSALLNAIHAINECVDMDDIDLVSLVNPKKGEKDVRGQSINIEVNLKNYSNLTAWEEIAISAIISSEKQGIVQTFTLSGSLDLKELGDTIYKFKDTYTVPEEEQYRIIVFIDKKDEYQHNDTLIETRETIAAPSIKGINTSNVRLEQNIPNPANNSTIINYSVPAEGEVLFTVYSVSGQVLYTKSENVQSGDNQIEINTSTFAAGVYFYTMEFEGQRLTKRMSIKR